MVPALVEVASGVVESSHQPTMGRLQPTASNAKPQGLEYITPQTKLPAQPLYSLHTFAKPTIPDSRCHAVFGLYDYGPLKEAFGRGAQIAERT